MKTYRGQCHCARVTFDAQADLDYVVDCNCSLCSKKGALWHPASEADLRILTGEGDLVLYQFNTKTAKHYFCRHCGIHPFYVPRSDPDKIDINVRCLDGIDLVALAVKQFDGRNWEAAIEQRVPWR